MEQAPTTDENTESQELIRAKEALLLSMDAFRIPEFSKTELAENPYRLFAKLGISGTETSEIPAILSNFYDSQREYALTLAGDEDISENYLEDSLFQESMTFLKNATDKIQQAKSLITKNEESIYSGSVSPERDIEASDTIHDFIEMNKDTVETPPDCWDADAIKQMSLDDYLEHIATYSSGRSFCHTFPMISFKQGEIVTGLGGDARSDEGFENVRDGGGSMQINFTPESIEKETNTYRHRFYIGLREGGHVYFPAEVLLDNYAMINLPYDQKNNWVSSEWRNVAPHEEPESDLHAIPLSLGIVFFGESDRKEYEDMTSKNPELTLPHVVFIDEGKERVDEALNRILEEAGVNKKAGSLPKTANLIRPIGEINGATIFGSTKAQKQW